jgi:phospholipase/carboxylesterase
MSELELAGLRVHLNQSALDDPGSMKSAVVLLHGFGAPGTDLVSIGDVLSVPPNTGLFFPEGPLDLGQLIGPQYSAARAWWPIEMAQLQLAMMAGQVDRATRSLATGLDQARERICQLLDELQSQFHLDASRIVLGGFSQGAIAALDVALRDSRDFAGLLLMSATLVDPKALSELAPGRAGTRALLSHGQFDPILPYPVAESLQDNLTRAGWDLTWVSVLGGHGIPVEVIRAASRLLPEWLA